MWACVAISGLAALIIDIAAGSGAKASGFANQTMLALLFTLHALNLARTGRRRSAILVVPFGVITAIGVAGAVAHSAVRWDELIMVALLCWMPAAGADVVYPESTYLSWFPSLRGRTAG
jgi:hypothetical protein